MRERFDDCIFCGGRNGSAEHLVLAALGGLRTDRGVLCDACNGSFNELDSALANDMRPLNAMVGVRHGRTKDSLRTDVQDGETGRTYVLSGGRQLTHAEPLILEDRIVDGVRNVYAVASTQEQADEFVHRMRAEGKPITVKRERVPLLLTSPPLTTVTVGGPVTFRAVARVALNLFAHHYPAMAREAWLGPLKRFIRHGEGGHVAYAYEGVDPALPADSFVFQHRFVFGMDSATGNVCCHVSLFGVVELAVTLGTTNPRESETLVHDVDVTATVQPHDVRVHRLLGVALCQPGATTPDALAYLQERLRRLAQKRADVIWEADAPNLLRQLNAARELPLSERHRNIEAALMEHRQRLLNLAVYVRHGLAEHLNAHLSSEAAEVADALGVLVQSDGKSKTGVTQLTSVHTDMLCHVMADALGELLADHPLSDAEVRSMLEGPQGVAIIGRYMIEELQKSHPAFRES